MASKKKGTKSVETIETVEVPIPLSPEELAAATLNMVRESRALDAHLDEKREFLSEWREKHKSLKEEHDRLRSVVADKAAPRKTKCTVVFDFGKNEVRYLELKTRKLIYARKMSKEDRQLHLPGTLPEKTGGNGVTDKPPAGEEGKPVRGTSKKPEVESPRPATVRQLFEETLKP